MKFAAFYRNVNLGRPGAPTKSQLEAAYHDNGAAMAQSFLVNGTLVFEAPSTRQAGKLARAAGRQLARVCGLAEPVFVRSLPALTGLVASDPFRGQPLGQGVEGYVTFLADHVAWPSQLPTTAPRGDLRVLQWDGVAMLSLLARGPQSPNAPRTPTSPNAFAEKLLGCTATTRVWNTLCRLVDRHG